MIQGKDWERELKEIAFQPGDYLFHEGEADFHFFVVSEGEVDILRKDERGIERTIATVAPPVSVGEFAMIDRKPRSASARAKTRVRATMISEAAYEQLLLDLPDWAMAVMKSLIERIRAANEFIAAHRVSENPNGSEEIVDADFDFGATYSGQNPYLKKPEGK